MYALVQEKGKRVRLDRKSEEPLNNMHDGRPAAARLGLGLEWAELDPLRETLSASAHTAGKRVGTLEFFDAFSHSIKKPACVESETPQKTCPGENNSTPQVTSKNILFQNAHSFCKNGTSQCRTCRLRPTLANPTLANLI